METFIVNKDNKNIKVEITDTGQGNLQVTFNNNTYLVNALEAEKNVYSLLVNGESFEATVESNNSDYQVYFPFPVYSMKIFNEYNMIYSGSKSSPLVKGSGKITAPMPGQVVKLLVKVGDAVKEGCGLIVIEAMKMENELKSPVTGIVKTIHVREGEAVEGNEPLMDIE